MTERDRIYIEILGFALPQIRNAAQSGLLEYCAIEAEHIHNLPSLIGELNERRHEYYFNAERELYLDRVDRTLPHVQWLLARYADLWRELESLNNA